MLLFLLEDKSCTFGSYTISTMLFMTHLVRWSFISCNEYLVVPQSLDLTYSGSEEFAVSRSLGERGNVDVSGLKRDHTYEDGEEQDEYHEEEDDGEEEDDDDDDDDYDGGGGNSNRVPATFITAFLAAQVLICV